MSNLQGGNDAFQENEIQEILINERRIIKEKSNREDKGQNVNVKDAKYQNVLESNLQYHSCKKLILNVDLVVKDYKGQVLI